jgi:hypothetical protein
VDGAGAVGEASAVVAGSQSDDLGRDGDRRLFGSAGTEIQADGAGYARELVLGCSFFPQPGGAVFVGAAAAHRPDVSGVRIERGF